jgi:hypothetical protein
MLDNYFYDKQLRHYILQFAAVFAGLQVYTGKGQDGNVTGITVPCIVGNRDRVVSAIMQGNTNNSPIPIPSMSVNLQGLELAPERRKGIGHQDRKTYLPTQGVFPDDLKVVHRLMPIPYNANFELSIYSSNTDQMHQILEQILIVFDPILQIQISDAPFDWTKITHIELIGIVSEENYPLGQDRRILVWSLTFMMPIYLSAPMDLKKNIVEQVNLRFGNLDTFSLSEVDANGDLVPFTDIWGITTVNH